jgi:pyruvate/2-oxoglutarate dehydrogenase complex dihydrolipoamide dehydrogenase (E3) component
LKRQPKSLAIIGGGPVAVELGQAFQRLGTKVTLIVRGDQLLGREDYDVSNLLHK